MRVTFDLDTSNPHDDATFLRLLAALGVDTEPVKGNPDEASLGGAAGGGKTELVAAEAKAAEAKAVALRADAPPEIVKLAASPADKATLGNAVLKACKPLDEGGRTRPVVIAILEKFRPAGNTDQPLKMGAIDKANYPALAALILAEYKA